MEIKNDFKGDIRVAVSVDSTARSTICCCSDCQKWTSCCSNNLAVPSGAVKLLSGAPKVHVPKATLPPAKWLADSFLILLMDRRMRIATLALDIPFTITFVAVALLLSGRSLPLPD